MERFIEFLKKWWRTAAYSALILGQLCALFVCISSVIVNRFQFFGWCGMAAVAVIIVMLSLILADEIKARRS